MTTATRLRKGQAGGLALVQKYGREHMENIGCLGGRPRAPTIDNIPASIAPAAKKRRKEIRRRESLKELLGLWEIKQASSGIIAQGGACLLNSERSNLENI